MKGGQKERGMLPENELSPKFKYTRLERPSNNVEESDPVKKLPPT